MGKAAKLLALKVKGDLYETVPREVYTGEDLNWHDPKSRSSVEIADERCRPAIEEVDVDVQRYDTIYIGFPIWWGIAPNVVKTFLDEIDYRGKKLITFCTSGGSGLELATIDLKDTYKDADIESGRRM